MSLHPKCFHLQYRRLLKGLVGGETNQTNQRRLFKSPVSKIKCEVFILYIKSRLLEAKCLPFLHRFVWSLCGMCELWVARCPPSDLWDYSNLCWLIWLIRFISTRPQSSRERGGGDTHRWGSQCVVQTNISLFFFFFLSLLLLLACGHLEAGRRCGFVLWLQASCVRTYVRLDLQ